MSSSTSNATTNVNNSSSTSRGNQFQQQTPLTSTTSNQSSSSTAATKKLANVGGAASSALISQTSQQGQQNSTSNQTNNSSCSNSNITSAISSSGNGSGGFASSSASCIQLDQVNEVMKRIAPAITEKINSEAIYFFLSLLSTLTSYYSIYKLNVFTMNFRLLIYSVLVQTRRFVSRLMKGREASDPLNLEAATPLLIIIHSIIALNIIYLLVRLLQDTSSYTAFALLLGYHVIYLKFGHPLTEQEHQFGSTHDITFYLKVSVMKISEALYFSYLLPQQFRSVDVAYDSRIALGLACITAINLILFLAMEVFINIGSLNKSLVQQLGRWHVISEQTAIARMNPSTEWQENHTYEQNSVVQHRGKYYQAAIRQKLARPGSLKHILFYEVFNKASRSRKVLIILVALLMSFQDFLVLRTTMAVTFSLSLVQTLVVAIYLLVENHKLNVHFN